jgi:hypothetical protein
MNFVNGIFSEEQLSAFLDSVKKRPEAMALLNRLIDDKLGRVPPVVYINFVESDGDGHPRQPAPALLQAAPANSKGHA